MADRGSSRTSSKAVNYKLLDSVGKSSPVKIDSKESGAIHKIVSGIPSKSPVATGVSPSTLSYISHSLHDTSPMKCPDDEKEDLKKKLQEIEAKTASLKEKRDIEQLKKQVEEKEREFLSLQKEMSVGGACGGDTASTGRSKTINKKGTVHSSTSSSLDINDLRNMKKLRRQAKHQLTKHGLVESESTSDSDSSSSDSSVSGSDSELSTNSSVKNKSKKKHKKKKSKKSSGLTSKASDSIKNRQRYPHAHLRFDHASSNLAFDKLDFNLFVAGELEIISSSKTGSLERKGRIELLKKLMYLSSSFEYQIIKSLYAAVLREVELGHLNWGEDFQYVESAVLQKSKGKYKSNESFQFRPKPGYSLPKEGSSSPASEDKVWYCPKYQSNKCSHKSSHVISFKGKSKMAKHVCATCYVTDKKELSHPECSSACPHQN